ncbi:GNAT family N-acetyltransferase [Dokdonia sp. Hel_I_53]|uniref:GNAT family N-acetyltransferase n=1 Tax=Dokdonia sp. Hel_I_53 TaxID=1566287 RepID=UPI00119A4ABA|nr:GNAT family N-acetyltransferase [Dokdonia sp. Hel_I_53]TVZ50955.1 acetyltransferase (GNAT) family protein [Dokdonia sp. Hel_I_53]
MEIRKATLDNLEDIIPLFDGYRQFYRQKSDLEAAKSFITSRLQYKDSTIFLCYKDDSAVGFTQLYPLFSSVTMQPMLLLNDLFIAENYRGQGIGTALINEAKELCTKTQQKGLVIQTEITNPAQKLYERLNFKKDPDLHYFWTCH